MGRKTFSFTCKLQVWASEKHQHNGVNFPNWEYIIYLSVSIQAIYTKKEKEKLPPSFILRSGAISSMWIIFILGTARFVINKCSPAHTVFVGLHLVLINYSSKSMHCILGTLQPYQNSRLLWCPFGSMKCIHLFSRHYINSCYVFFLPARWEKRLKCSWTMFISSKIPFLICRATICSVDTKNSEKRQKDK